MISDEILASGGARRAVDYSPVVRKALTLQV